MRPGLDEQGESKMPAFCRHAFAVPVTFQAGGCAASSPPASEMDRGVLTPAWGESMADGEFESHPRFGSVIAGWRSSPLAGDRGTSRAGSPEVRPMCAVHWWEIAVAWIRGRSCSEASFAHRIVDHVLPAGKPQFATTSACAGSRNSARADLGMHPLTVP